MDSVKHQLRKLTSVLFAVLLITGTSAVGVMLVMPGVFAQTSDNSTDPTVSLEHDSIEIGQTVTWTQTVELATPDAVAIEVPSDAEITDVQTSSGETVDLGSVTTTDVAPADTTVVASPDPEMVQEGGDTTLAVIDESADGYNISFETPAPYTVEQDTSTDDLYQKEVTVAHDSALHYTDVKSYSDIPEDLVSQGVEFKLFWMVDGVKTDVTANPQYAVSFVDTNGNGVVDQMQWTVPQLSEQQFVIEGIILAIDAEHLDSSRNVIENVYDQIKERDGIWTNPIPAGDYIRVTFERNLNNTNDITIVARSDSPDSSIEVYEKDGITAIANFGAVSEEGMYKIYLTNLIGDQKTFDLKVIGNPVEFDYITDPAATGGTSTSTVVAGIASADLEKTIGAGTNQLLLVGVSIKDSTDSVSGITWRSTCGTVAGSQSLVSSGAAASANGVRSEIWELVAPTQRVSGHVCVTFSGSVTKAVVGATDFTGVDQANPTPNANTATGTTDGSTTASQSVTSSSGNLVFGHTATDNNDNIGEGASQTNQWETADAVSNNKILGAASTKSSSAGSSTISHTSINQNSVHWAFSIVEVKSAPVVVGADLSISKSDSPDPVAEGGTITYTIGVSNAGPDTATSL